MKAPSYAFSPSCNPDGTYLAKQCYLERYGSLLVYCMHSIMQAAVPEKKLIESGNHICDKRSYIMFFLIFLTEPRFNVFFYFPNLFHFLKTFNGRCENDGNLKCYYEKNVKRVE